MSRQTPWWYPEGLRPLEPAGWPAVVYFTGAKVAHVGDLYHGFDTLSMPTDAEGMMLTLRGIASRLPRDAKLVTGHGGVTGVAEFLRYERMYTDVLAHVRRRIAAGESLEAIQKTGLPEPRKSQWKGEAAQVPKWLDSMHRSLTGAGAEAG